MKTRQIKRKPKDYEIAIQAGRDRQNKYRKAQQKKLITLPTKSKKV